MSYSRYRSGRYGHVNWKEWHADKRAALSRQFGGIDQDVKTAFLGLKPRTLVDFFRSYQSEYGYSAASYARETYRSWQKKAVEPSAQTLERLLRLLPSFLPFETKYDLLRKLREAHKSIETYKVDVSIWTWKQQLEPIVRHVIQKAYKSQLPVEVEDRLRWLSSGQMQAAKQLLAEAEAQAGRIAVSHLAEEVEKIERVLVALPAKQKSATHTIVLPYGTINLTINRRPRMDNEKPTPERDTAQPSASTSLEKVIPGSILQTALKNLDREQIKRISDKAIDEHLALEVEAKKANQRFENSSRDLDEFVHGAERLDQQRTSDYHMHGEFKTASGTTSVRVAKEGSKITIVVAVVIGLVLVLLFMSRH
jgi:hypothetical protein